MEHDEWTIVKIKKNNKSHGSNNNNKRNNAKKKNTKKSNIVIDNNDDDDGSSYDDVMKTINTTIIELKRSSYYNKLIETIKTSLESKNSNNISNNISNNNDDDTCEYKLKEIVSLGIGSFSKSPSALLQLVMTLCLAQEFLHDNDDSKEANKYNCIVFDPIFNDVEVLVCNSLGLNASKENKFGKHNAVHDNDSQYKTTLFFMPHCPYRLYCNLLWQNWSNLANLIIYGNSFSSYGLRRMHALSSEKTDLTDCIVCMESFTIERSLALDISRHNMPKELLHMENAFNDLRY